MSRLLKSFFYKISKDITFRITLIIGAGMAIFMTLLYFLIDRFAGEGFKMLSGQSMLVSSFSPAQNYGIAIPINIVSFVVLEFTQGTIRNKIIAGNSKFKIYVSLFISGLVLAMSLLLVYVAVCTLFGTIFGGFNMDEIVIFGSTAAAGKVSAEFIVKFIILGILSYTSIVAFAVLVATFFRSIGPSIPMIFVGILLFSMLAMILGAAVSTMKQMAESTQISIVQAMAKIADPKTDAETVEQLTLALPEMRQRLANYESTTSTLNNVCNVLKVVDPLYGISTVTVKDGVATIDDLTFYGGIGSNIFYGGVFFILGAHFFKKRDIK